MTGQQALGSRYVLEGRIGSGGMGAVWRGRDRGNGRPVAVKLLHEQFATDPAVPPRPRPRSRPAQRGIHTARPTNYLLKPP